MGSAELAVATRPTTGHWRVFAKEEVIEEVVQSGCKHTTVYQDIISYEFGLSSDHTTTYQDKNGSTMLEGRNGAATAADTATDVGLDRGSANVVRENRTATEADSCINTNRE